MKSFLAIFDRPEYEAALSLGKGSRVLLSGLAGGMKGQFAARLLRDTQRQVIALAASPVEARELWIDASSVLGEESVVYVGSEHPHVVKSLEALDSAFVENVENLRRLLGAPGKLVVMPQEMLLAPVPSPGELMDRIITVNTGDTLGMTGFIHRLSRGGYDRKEFVETTGDYAVRGGILDVFPAGFENPVRFEFFGDNVDSLREFDALSQRSIRTLDRVSFMDSLYLQEEDRDSTAGRVADFFHPDAVLFIEEAARFNELLDESDERGRLEEMRSRFPAFEHSILPHDGGPNIDFGGELQPAFNGSVKFLREDLRNKLAEGWHITIVADSKPQATRMRDLLFSEDEPDSEFAGVRIITALLSRGFMIPDQKTACYTEHDIFNRKHVQKRAHRGFKGLSLREMRQLKPGDFVVHVDKGVGKFLGFETISVGGGKQETIKIAFDGGDMLYVNLNYINRISKYSGQEGKEPKLSRLGSAEWARLKARTKKRLKDIARDLIALYAKRKLARGFPFPPDNEWQKELEASFIYEDTPDQAQATREVKVDMESPVPMDRLICGDVGFGKTEVAVRAAFKAVMAGRQVAILVPTTILAQQHYHTFNDRLHRYAIRVESLSRFRSPKRTREILDGLSRGTVDIVIGTHRMLSRDVEFKNLGLLVIDEEHRFGVAAKERLRKMREHIDTLTLTATPIPRTLNFSLLGARDLSIIETPPRNRLPIITEIIPFDQEIIREGITRELERGGQVYFVNDRVNDIDILEGTLRRLLPGARMETAHGQMKNAELERVMMRFLERKIDVLITTKIIESGLDIPNANTIFINRAERFGLAELYQLRGRVGRANEQAYAYLIIDKGRKLSRQALRRLQALEEFMALGSGFQLAMRDLEIRGAGNLLGAEQSGFIYEIGFDLFVKTLEEAVRELKAEEFGEVFDTIPEPEKEVDTVVELGIDAIIPGDYVSDPTERYDYYRRLYNLRDEGDVNDILEELADRFGDPPAEVHNLANVVQVRRKAARVGFQRISVDSAGMTVVFPSAEHEEFYDKVFPALANRIMKERDRMRLEQDDHELRLLVREVVSLEDVNRMLDWLLEEPGMTER